MLSESSKFAAGPTPDEPPVYDAIPGPIRAELNADMDHDVLARMRDLARKKRTLQPETTDEEMADYLALAEGFQNFAQWLSTRHGTIESSLHASAAWMVACVAIVGLLTVMLIVGIAIAV